MIRRRIFAIVLNTFAIATAAPLTITFTGSGSGALGSTQFSDQVFTIVLTSDTRLVATPSCCSNDMSTPSGTPATITVSGVSATFEDTQSVFVNPGELNIGIWHYGGPDWLTIGNSSFGTYNLNTNLGPSSGTTSILGNSMDTSAGMLSMTSVSNVTMEIHVGPNVVWTNNTTRRSLWWYFNGAGGDTEATWAWLSEAGVGGWHVAAMIDFNGDGYSDLIWVNDKTRQAVVWYMGGPGGNVEQSWEWLSQSGVPGWSLVGAADFNGDGIPDLLWENDSNQRVVIWYMAGPGTSGNHTWAWLSEDGVPGWTIKAVGDYNKDGTPDVVWQNQYSQSLVWYLGSAGTTELSWEWISADGVPGWSIAGMGDFNGDGILDLLLVDDSTQQAVVWYLQGPGTNGQHSWSWLSQAGVYNWSAIVAQ